MKKCLLIILSLLSVSIISCTKTPKLDDRLVGTKWQTEDLAAELFHGGKCYQVYEFTSTTEVECYTTKNGTVISSDGVYTYKLNWPSITINVVSSGGEVTPTSYTFTDARTMVRDNAASTAFYVTYIRQ